MFLAQYQVLRENGHSPSEAFNEVSRLVFKFERKVPRAELWLRFP
jgi:hypothetical protein